MAIEGPYGAFTPDARRGDRVALIGAGVGITPLRAIADDMPLHVDVVMLARAHHPDDLILRDELRLLLRQRGGRLHELIGPRSRVTLDQHALSRLIPDIARRDVYICGPTGFTASVGKAVRALGVPMDRIHHETFAS
ncbi:MAG: hypothetical protein ACR2NR_01300 [Solirubrobacteraceae bacterium]